MLEQTAALSHVKTFLSLRLVNGMSFHFVMNVSAYS
jgi:hypothetical protein